MLYIKITSGVICAENTDVKDAEDFTCTLLDKLTDVIEELGAEWCVGFDYGEDIQKKYSDIGTDSESVIKDIVDIK